MKLARVDVRFFRSFNFDYELRARENSSAPPWDISSPWFPFIRVAIEADITAVVGANEAGKSQLLDAVKAALTGSPIERADFCRYSELYSVRAGEIRLPEFGATFRFDADETRPGLPALQGGSEFSLYRLGDSAPFVVVDDVRSELTPPELLALEAHLPTIHELRTNLALPDSVSIAQLAGKSKSPLHERSRRHGLFARLFAGATTEAEAGAAVWPSLQPALDEASVLADRKQEAEFQLARELLVDVAGVAVETFQELEQALAAGREGQVEAIVGGINSAIRDNLNVQRWWTQDRDFDLRVEAREQELAFTIRDRTAAKYSFRERSQGLRFFLSYFVQLTAHRLKNGKPDILLLDEPDAYLSSVGQQDLLRVLQEYADPEDGGARCQVIYVTHSPFLIDRNSPHRIRVLDKGSEDEGTRVVRDAANNRYEPLRSALGAFVAETAFIGGQNLFVEGLGDQILIAGLASFIARREKTATVTLDLNIVTVVAAGGADSVPYMVYLARGRDSVKPACVALLDGDEAGQSAQKVLQRGEARKKRILKDEYIVRLDTWAASRDLHLEAGVQVVEIEDLVPVAVAHRGALNYLARFADLEATDTATFSANAILDAIPSCEGNVWKALSTTYANSFPGEHLEKAGFAREVVTLLAAEPELPGVEQLRIRFSLLLKDLSDVLQDAQDEEDGARTDDRLKRAVKGFLRNHPTGMRKVDARRLLREIENALGTSDFADELRSRTTRLAREFELQDVAEPMLARFAEFRDEIRAFGSVERIAYQDDALSDPAATVLDNSIHETSTDGRVGPRAIKD